jgi:CelD/BcsL family acetyltransferase involved in cellulose biosynthesis
VAGKFGLRWIGWEFDRPVLRPATTTPEQIEASLTRNRRKRIRRSKRQLGQIGNVGYEIVRCGMDWTPHAENFLRLEHMGWKRAEETSLRSHSESEAFFLEMTEGFENANRMVFCELKVDDTVIGSTSNFLSGDAGFAYKIGWDPEFQQYSPGVLQEVEFAKVAHCELHNVEYFDSCTDQDSFMESLWPDRRTLTNGAFVAPGVSRLAVAGMLQLRLLKRKWKNRRAE